MVICTFFWFHSVYRALHESKFYVFQVIYLFDWHKKLMNDYKEK